MSRLFNLLLIGLATLGTATNVHAHFPWLTIEDGKAVYFFGEDPSDRTYKLPESITKAEVHAVQADGQPQKIGLRAIESDHLLGMTSEGSVRENASLVSKVTYGIYHGMRLEYYSQHQGGKIPTDRTAYAGVEKQLDLHAEVVDTDNGVDVFVMWKGKPLADAEVLLFCEDGHEEGKEVTDQNGRVSFNDKQVEDGVNGIRVGYTQKDEAGKLEGAEYTSVANYLTMTFLDPEDFEN